MHSHALSWLVVATVTLLACAVAPATAQYQFSYLPLAKPPITNIRWDWRNGPCGRAITGNRTDPYEWDFGPSPAYPSWANGDTFVNNNIERWYFYERGESGTLTGVYYNLEIQIPGLPLKARPLALSLDYGATQPYANCRAPFESFQSGQISAGTDVPRGVYDVQVLYPSDTGYSASYVFTNIDLSAPPNASEASMVVHEPVANSEIGVRLGSIFINYIRNTPNAPSGSPSHVSDISVTFLNSTTECTVVVMASDWFDPSLYVPLSGSPVGVRSRTCDAVDFGVYDIRIDSTYHVVGLPFQVYPLAPVLIPNVALLPWAADAIIVNATNVDVELDYFNGDPGDHVSPSAFDSFVNVVNDRAVFLRGSVMWSINTADPANDRASLDLATPGNYADYTAGARFLFYEFYDNVAVGMFGNTGQNVARPKMACFNAITLAPNATCTAFLDSVIEAVYQATSYDTSFYQFAFVSAGPNYFMSRSVFGSEGRYTYIRCQNGAFGYIAGHAVPKRFPIGLDQESGCVTSPEYDPWTDSIVCGQRTSYVVLGPHANTTVVPIPEMRWGNYSNGRVSFAVPMFGDVYVSITREVRATLRYPFKSERTWLFRYDSQGQRVRSRDAIYMPEQGTTGSQNAHSGATAFPEVSRLLVRNFNGWTQEMLPDLSFIPSPTGYYDIRSLYTVYYEAGRGLVRSKDGNRIYALELSNAYGPFRDVFVIHIGSIRLNPYPITLRAPVEQTESTADELLLSYTTGSRPTAGTATLVFRNASGFEFDYAIGDAPTESRSLGDIIQSFLIDHVNRTIAAGGIVDLTPETLSYHWGLTGGLLLASESRRTDLISLYTAQKQQARAYRLRLLGESPAPDPTVSYEPLAPGVYTVTLRYLDGATARLVVATVDNVTIVDASTNGTTPTCSNHGTRDTGLCTCESGWHGPICSETLASCSRTSCRYDTTGLVCTDTVNGRYRCEAPNCAAPQVYTFENGCRCAHGYTGAECTTLRPCAENGVPNEETGACTCNPGYYGPTCTQTRQQCTDALCGNGYQCGPTVNGTTRCELLTLVECAPCQNLVHSYCDPYLGECRCAGGWYGETCNQTITECRASTCTGESNACRPYRATHESVCVESIMRGDPDAFDTAPCNGNGVTNATAATVACTCFFGFGRYCNLTRSECNTAWCPTGHVCGNTVHGVVVCYDADGGEVPAVVEKKSKYEPSGWRFILLVTSLSVGVLLLGWAVSYVIALRRHDAYARLRDTNSARATSS